MDYETFTNEGLGLGTWQPTLIIVFWLVVMILIVISQNIVLSIVVSAYEEVRALLFLFLTHVLFHDRCVVA